jgi:hypothetical protein
MPGMSVRIILRRYREGRLSLGMLARELGRSISETLDLLTDFGIRAPTDYDDYLQGYTALRPPKRPAKGRRRAVSAPR